MPDTQQEDRVAPLKDHHGQQVDPPRLQEFEARIADASNRADQDDLNDAQAEYHQARAERQKVLNQRAKAAEQESK